MPHLFQHIRESIRKETSGIAIPFIAFGVALNLSLGQIAALVKIPLYLDSIGTVLVAVLCGPWAGMIAGTIANIIAGIVFSPALVFFIPTVVTIGAFTGFWANRGFFKRWYTVIPGGVLQGAIAAIISAPISAYLFSGITLGGTDFLVLYFRSMGKSILDSTILQGISSDPVDKTLTYFIAFLVAKRLPRNLVLRFPHYENILSNTE